MGKIPQISRKPAKLASARSIFGGPMDLPNSGGGWALRQLRPYLPVSWQYGRRFTLLKGTWIVAVLAAVGYLANRMFFMAEEEVIYRASKYTYVRDDSGSVVDLSYKPLIDSAVRAKRRTQRLYEHIKQEEEL